MSLKAVRMSLEPKNYGTVPPELFYTKNHLWISVDENIVTFGLTEFALEQLGEVLYVDLPDDSSRITMESSCGSIESVRNIMDLIAPFNGLVIEINSRLNEDPSNINDDPYGTGWLFMAEIENERELANLIRHQDYKTYLSDFKVLTKKYDNNEQNLSV